MSNMSWLISSRCCWVHAYAQLDARPMIFKRWPVMHMSRDQRGYRSLLDLGGTVSTEIVTAVAANRGMHACCCRRTFSVFEDALLTAASTLAPASFPDCVELELPILARYCCVCLFEGVGSKRMQRRGQTEARSDVRSDWGQYLGHFRGLCWDCSAEVTHQLHRDDNAEF